MAPPPQRPGGVAAAPLPPQPAAEEDDEEAGDWACLTEADLEADLLECEEAAAVGNQPLAAGRLGADAVLEEDRLRKALRRGPAARAGAALDADVFLAAPRALHDLAAQLQELLVEVDTLRFERAALAASLAHGPLRPPKADAGTGPGDDTDFAACAANALRVVKPPPLELSLPAQATGPADYQRLLEAFPRVLYIERRVKLCMADVDRYQDSKDISRDQLVVNGTALSGAKGGYTAAVEAVTAGLLAGAAGECWRPEATERAAQLVLSVLNRTSSGFAAFEEVLRLFDCPSSVIIAPDSAAARPLEAVVLGGCALGRAHTRYAVRHADAAGEPLAVVDAEFAFRAPTAMLRRLAESRDLGDVWPSEEISAAILLRCSSR